ncbi:hypothetical protein DESC_720305 [Desulfosarcina cetonica]|nr:hypothetical protein DESC_720305 [Desulfosarcina cetonica]
MGIAAMAQNPDVGFWGVVVVGRLADAGDRNGGGAQAYAHGNGLGWRPRLGWPDLRWSMEAVDGCRIVHTGLRAG